MLFPMLVLLLCLVLNPFDKLMSELMHKYEIPAAAFAISKNDELIHTNGYGAPPGALFRIASVSKPITAVAVMQLVEQGKINLDARAFELLKLGEPADRRTGSITVRDLLQHTGGWDRNVSFDPMFRPEATSTGAIIRFMLTQQLDFDPGRNHAYSNFGYCVLGRIIEQATGLRYEEYVKRHVLKPLGIERMRIGARTKAEHAPDEVEYDGPTAYRLRPDVMDAHGGWIASAPDLVKFANGLPRLLKPETIRIMTARPSVDLWKNTRGWYALGWQVVPRGGGVNLAHGGAMSGTSALLVRDYDGHTWAVLFNHMPPVTSPFMNELDRGVWEALNAFSSSANPPARDRSPEAQPAP
ncbi:MAG TPA: serine hydrolase domain-containing protein [Bryobacteraceae bacterium]|nr:serine hydrolase domain-containing protein [Bryobacteraceae bacterium]